MSPVARFGAAALALSAALATAAPAQASVQARLTRHAAAAPTARIEAIVQFAPGTPAARRQALVAAAGGRVVRALPVIDGAGVSISARGAVALGRRAGVRHVTENTAIRGDSTAPAPADAPATSFLASARIPQAWMYGAAGRGVGVAVIDTGIAGDLADFRRSTENHASRVIASAVTDPRATTATDRYGHGTHVAGLVAGNGNALDRDDPLRRRYAGAAPHANLVSVKASADDGSASLMDAIAGLQFVVEHREQLGIRVVNLSASASEPESHLVDPLDAAVESAWRQGIVVVVAAGNRGSEAGAVDYAPGNDPYAISVGAVDDHGTDRASDDSVPDWSSRGTTRDGHVKPDVLAPGAHIVAPLAPDSAFAALCPDCLRGGGRYFQVSGTSMAAPIVAGVAADLLSVAPWLTPDQVKAAIVSGTRRTADGNGEIAADRVLFRGFSPHLVPANQGLPLNEALDPATGEIDFDKLSWGKLSWGAADGDLVAPWAKLSWGKLSWGCAQVCDGADSELEQTKLSWGKLSWGKLSWGKLSWGSFLGQQPAAELAGGSTGAQDPAGAAAIEAAGAQAQSDAEAEAAEDLAGG